MVVVGDVVVVVGDVVDVVGLVVLVDDEGGGGGGGITVVLGRPSDPVTVTVCGSVTTGDGGGPPGE